MYKIADFNSLWEIGFAMNAILVYFELLPIYKKKFIGMQSIGSDSINKYIKKQDQRYVSTSGWRSFCFGYVVWIERLKSFSIICSIVAFISIIIGGFNPTFSMGIIGISILIICQFTPIIAISYIILRYLPKYKLKCINHAIEELITQNEDNVDFQKKHLKQYTHLVEHIIFYSFNSLPNIKREKDRISHEELMEIYPL